MRKKITIIANSVALRVRPVENNIKKKVYSILLEEALNNRNDDSLWEVTNMGKSRLIVKEVYDSIDDYISQFPCIFIINLGCVDAPNREIPLWFSDIIYKRSFKKLFFLFNSFYQLIIKKYFRTWLVILRGRKSWVSLTKFENDIKETISILLKETNARIIILGINEGNDRIERILPGTNNKYAQYSKILKKISGNDRISFINVSDLSSEAYFPDGVHYNQKGHIEICKRILREID